MTKDNKKETNIGRMQVTLRIDDHQHTHGDVYEGKFGLFGGRMIVWDSGPESRFPATLYVHFVLLPQQQQQQQHIPAAVLSPRR